MPPGATVALALQIARRRVPTGEANLLLRECLGLSAAALVTYPGRTLSADEAERFQKLVSRRASGEPIAYLVGRREFYGLDFAVAPGVLIPRPETELLVDWAVERLQGRPEPKILDLGTGSGCIAVTLALKLPYAQVTAVDRSPQALAIARANGDRLGAEVEWIESDWFVQLGGRKFDLIASNPPYVAVGDPHLTQGDVRFEPGTALTSGEDGLDAIRHIVSTAACHLTPGGYLGIEHGYDQAERCRGLMAAAGFAEVFSHRDLSFIERATVGRLPISSAA